MIDFRRFTAYGALEHFAVDVLARFEDDGKVVVWGADTEVFEDEVQSFGVVHGFGAPLRAFALRSTFGEFNPFLWAEAFAYRRDQGVHALGVGHHTVSWTSSFRRAANSRGLL